MYSYAFLSMLDDFLSQAATNINKENRVLIKVILACNLLGIDTPELAKKFATNEYLANALCISNDQLINIMNSVCLSYPDHLFSSRKINEKEMNIYEMVKDSLVSEWAERYKNFAISSGRCVESYRSFDDDDQFKRTFLSQQYVLGPKILDDFEIDDLNNEILEYAAYERTKDKAHIYGNGKLQRIWKLPEKIKWVDRLLQNKLIISTCDMYFDRETMHDKFYLTSFQANILYPGAVTSIWHRDANIIGLDPKWPVKINFGIPLIDLNKETGATEFKVGSHEISGSINALSLDSYCSTHAEAKRGTLNSWSGNIWHRSTVNSSKNPRVLILICFANSVLREQSQEESYAHFKINEQNYFDIEWFKRLSGGFQGIRHGII